MDSKTVIEVISQVAFPIVLILAVVYWVGRYGLPKIAEAFEKIVTNFRDEVKTEREYHSRNIERFFEVQDKHTEALKNEIRSGRDEIVCKINEKCGPPQQ